MADASPKFISVPNWDIAHPSMLQAVYACAGYFSKRTHIHFVILAAPDHFHFYVLPLSQFLHLPSTDQRASLPTVFSGCFTYLRDIALAFSPDLFAPTPQILDGF